jgi:hypothetical protein
MGALYGGSLRAFMRETQHKKNLTQSQNARLHVGQVGDPLHCSIQGFKQFT